MIKIAGKRGIDLAGPAGLTPDMKCFLPALVLAVAALVGCAGKQNVAKPVFNENVPGPSLSPSPSALPSAEAAPAVAASAPESPGLIVTPENALTGKVVVYNDAGRFVVLDFPIGHMPAVDQRMFIYRRGLKVGEVKITGPQRDHNIVADLAQGEAQAGDEARDK